jgi:hypothetical protein
VDPTNHLDPLERIYRLLALCARTQGFPALYEQLTSQLEGFEAWTELPKQAELHGMAPLLRHHLIQAGVSIPAETQRVITGLYLRHRRLNQIHTRALLDVLSLFEQAGLQAVVLKGLGLAYQYYPDPALRPIGDIDLLLKRADIFPALDLLAANGFQLLSSWPSARLIPGELKVTSPLRNGISVHLELHHFEAGERSIIDAHSVNDEFMGFDGSVAPLSIGKNIVYVPDYADTLLYLVKHFTRHLLLANPERPLPLKWTADIISLVEQHATTLDWTHIRKQNPSFLNQLEVFYSLTPLPEHLEKIIPIRRISPPRGLNQYPQGLSKRSFFNRKISFGRYLWRAFTPPSEWWLRLYYGITEQPAFWYGQVVYRWQRLSRIFWILLTRSQNLGRPT